MEYNYIKSALEQLASWPIPVLVDLKNGGKYWLYVKYVELGYAYFTARPFDDVSEVFAISDIARVERVW